MPGERGPGAARVRGVRFSPRAGAASDPAIATPHESALSGPDRTRNILGLKSRAFAVISIGPILRDGRKAALLRMRRIEAPNKNPAGLAPAGF